MAQNTSVYLFDGAPNGDATFIPLEEPKEMDINEINNVIKEFVSAAKNAIEAGFDGVETVQNKCLNRLKQ